MDNTEQQVANPKKRSGFKRSLLWLVTLGVIGGAGYVAYQQGAMDRYLPNSLASQPTADDQPAPLPTEAKPADSVAPSDVKSNTESVPPAAPTAAAVIAAPSVSAPPASIDSNPTVAAPTSPSVAPVVIAINGAPANALLIAYDAQWQWSNIQQNYLQHADATLALQNLRNLKSELQASHEAAFAPALSALAQTEAQLQAWTAVPSASYLTALQNAIVAVDQLDVKPKDLVVVDSAHLSWWERIIASLKDVIAIKRIDSAKEAQMLSPASAALVKQSISARLLSAQWAAQTGQWGVAQTQVAAAQRLATEWSDPSALNAVQALIDAKNFPATPDFSAVATALQQARAQLTSAARAQQSAPAPSPAAPSSEPATRAVPMPPASDKQPKGGA